MRQSFSIGSFLPLRFRLWFGQKYFRPLGPNTFRVSWHRVIKGPCDPLEIEALQCVAEHTSIPVPRLHGHHTLDGLIYIEMAYIPGTTLDVAWLNLSKDVKSNIFADIKHHISALRKLEPPSQDIVSSAYQNPIHDCRIGFLFFGLLNHDEFHSLTRQHLRLEDVKADVLGQEVATTHSGRYRTCFTHADLAPRNIIVRDGHVAAIIDWGFAGWYPEYREYTRTHFNYVSEEWEAYLSEALPVHSTELGAERTLWKMLPEPGSSFSGTLSDGTTFTHKGTAPSEEWLATRSDLQSPDLWSLALERRR